MFVRVKKIGPYEYLYLVENAREGGRHVQRVVTALGRRDEVEASEMLDALVASAAGARHGARRRRPAVRLLSVARQRRRRDPAHAGRPFVSGRKIPFPGNGDDRGQRLGSNVGLILLRGIMAWNSSACAG